MEHFSTELDTLKRGQSGGNASRLAGQVEEEELVQLVVGILFAILWRGCVLSSPAAAARRRREGTPDQQGQLAATYGHIVAAVNLLGGKRVRAVIMNGAVFIGLQRNKIIFINFGKLYFYTIRVSFIYYNSLLRNRAILPRFRLRFRVPNFFSTVPVPAPVLVPTLKF
jgi:hypothetical protein